MGLGPQNACFMVWQVEKALTTGLGLVTMTTSLAVAMASQ